MNRIEEIRAREQKATPGPWKTDEKILLEGRELRISENIVVDKNGSGIGAYKNNVEFIACAREDILYLLDELAVKDAEIERLKAAFHEEELASMQYQHTSECLKVMLEGEMEKVKLFEVELAGYRDRDKSGEWFDAVECVEIAIKLKKLEAYQRAEAARVRQEQ